MMRSIKTVAEKLTMAERAVVLVILIGFLGCTGATLGENEAGDDTFLDGSSGDGVDDGETCTFQGSIAVDHRTETAFVVRTVAQAPCNGITDDTPSTKTLYAVASMATVGEKILDLSGSADLRVTFPKDKILIMQEIAGTDWLTLLDPHSFEVLDTVTTSGARYHGTRTSPSRRYLAVADNNVEGTAPIHLIDTETMETQIIPHDGYWLEAMWLNDSERLMAIVFYQGDADAGEADYARILSWSFEEDQPLSTYQVGEDGVWAGADIDIVLEGVMPDFLFSFTWVGISPDDAKAVFPVRTAEGHELAVLDLETRQVERVPDARGPVAFTPDGETIVSYRYVTKEEVAEGEPESEPFMLMVDVATLEAEPMPLPFDGGPSFYVSRGGSYLAAVPLRIGESGASTGDEPEQVVIMDLSRGESVTVESPGVSLTEFVSRDAALELWLVYDKGLHRLDFEQASLESLSLDFSPLHINLLPESDLLILDDQASDTLRFIDPKTEETVRSVQLVGLGG